MKFEESYVSVVLLLSCIIIYYLKGSIISPAFKIVRVYYIFCNLYYLYWDTTYFLEWLDQ